MGVPFNVLDLPSTSSLHVLAVHQKNAFDASGGGVAQKKALVNAQNIVYNLDLARLAILAAAFVRVDE